MIKVPVVTNKLEPPPNIISKFFCDKEKVTNLLVLCWSRLKNKKNILIVVPDNDATEVIKKNDLLFLEKILNSIGLTTEDIVIVNNQSKEKWTTFVRDFSPKKVLFFGIKPFELGIKELEIKLEE